MPTYEYHCKDCGYTFEIRTTIASFTSRSAGSMLGPQSPVGQHMGGSNISILVALMSSVVFIPILLRSDKF